MGKSLYIYIVHILCAYICAFEYMIYTRSIYYYVYNTPSPQALDRRTRHFHQLNPLSTARCLCDYKYASSI